MSLKTEKKHIKWFKAPQIYNLKGQYNKKEDYEHIYFITCIIRKWGLLTFNPTEQNRSCTLVLFALTPLIKYLFLPPITTLKMNDKGLLACIIYHLKQIDYLAVILKMTSFQNYLGKKSRWKILIFLLAPIFLKDGKDIIYRNVYDITLAHLSCDCYLIMILKS